MYYRHKDRYHILEDYEREDIRDSLEQSLRSANAYMRLCGEFSSELQDALYEPLRYMEWLLCEKGMMSDGDKTSKFSKLDTTDELKLAVEFVDVDARLHECLRVMGRCDYHKADLEIRDLIEFATKVLHQSEAFKTAKAVYNHAKACRGGTA